MLRSSFILILGRVLGAAFGLISGIFLARILGAEKLGQYQIFLSTQTILITLVTLGIGNASIYFINKGKISEKEIVSSFLKILAIIAAISCLCFYFVINKNTGYFGSIDSISFLLFLLGTASLIIISVLRPILYARQKVLQVTFTNLLPSFILIIGVLGLVLWNKLDVSNALSIWGIGNFLALLFSLFFHRHYISLSQKINIKNVSEITFYGVKLSASNLLFILIGNTSVFFIKMLSVEGFSDVGLYSRAIAISSIVYMIPTAVGPLLFSRWSSSMVKNEYELEIQKTLRIFNTISFVIILLGSVFSSLIIYALYGEEYLSIQKTLIILLFSLIFQVMSEVFNNYLASQGKAILTMYSLLASFLVIVIGNIILVPLYGINGSAIAVLLSSITNSMILYLMVRRSIDIKLVNILIINRSDVLFLKQKIKL
ncbi:oligosaccharide flippase family protein [Empedobacter tilapiae]|uniref:oligosaccharide flippase family protein n=1 Tax=Empedobacter tilapiae TaxID=2491114 RepID=UPI0028D5BDA4|nr:oligosaccharide flippase family protein [Empedobacter tilapiae]